MQLIDTHAHIFDETLLQNLTSVLNKASGANVTDLIVPAIDIPTGQLIIERLGSLDRVYFALGVHPNEAHKCTEEQWDLLANQIRSLRSGDSPESRKLVALGETGLDLYWDDCPLERQQDYLIRHLNLGKELNLPVIIHCRDAYDELGALLESFVGQNGPISGVIHSFSGDCAFLYRCLDWGFYVGFGGQITYRQKKFDPIREAAVTAPADRILVETDCPYLTPSPLRGKVEYNEPAYVAHTAAFLALIRGVSLDVLANQTTENARRLFRLGE